MNHQRNPELYSKCGSAFVATLAGTLDAVLKNQGALDAAQRKELLSRLTFAVCAHMSGSSFAGEVDGQEIYPVLGFSAGENSDAVYFGHSAALHESVPAILSALDT